MRRTPVFLRWSRVAIAASLLAALGSCEPFHSDPENFQREWERDRARRVAGMKEATKQTPRGNTLSGEQLRSALAGTTHVFVYGVSPGGRSGRYVEYASFLPDGKFVFRNSDGTAGATGATGSWRVDGPRLCIVNPYLTPEPQCFSMAKTSSGNFQYFVSQPGSDSDGLLTKVTDGVEPLTPNN